MKPVVLKRRKSSILEMADFEKKLQLASIFGFYVKSLGVYGLNGGLYLNPNLPKPAMLKVVLVVIKCILF